MPIDNEDCQRLEVGDPEYRAPEELLYEPENAHSFAISEKTDIWVVGRLMHSLMNLTTGYFPQQRLGVEPALPTFNPGIEATYPPELRRIVRQCVSLDPTNRPTIQVLWRDVHAAVASYVGLAGDPMKDWAKADDEVIRFAADRYTQFANPVAAPAPA